MTQLAQQPHPYPTDPDVASAGFFAREAKRYAKTLGDPEWRARSSADDRELLALEIQAFASASLALTQLNPPPRRRPRPARGVQ